MIQVNVIYTAAKTRLVIPVVGQVSCFQHRHLGVLPRHVDRAQDPEWHLYLVLSSLGTVPETAAAGGTGKGSKYFHQVRVTGSITKGFSPFSTTSQPFDHK
ncbi:hypothetical protein ATANTOWER_029357 [Ataeniobius toweri]|uniref:Uncharacterized protein n=1 Tax=Ataeniobius toweri TaxID=208326 RepID=A0ABU7BU14_9TELE|nr:hypothetical protein [Ataeniobius toweri]